MKTGKYIVVATTAIAALYVVFFGLAAILAVIDSVTWNDVWTWSGKIGIVAAIVLGINIVIAVLMGLLPQSSNKK